MDFATRHCSLNETVVELDERPAGLTPHQWFDFISGPSMPFQELVGGIGVLRLTRAAVDAFRQENATTSTSEGSTAT
ncbi:hypothetical protein [Bradyrhizobium valentinum]|uniref:Uncharacterized protein n=1 Tax=Bradyrhizobium valentinum TaxID=1518501 RepID=A0A0R3KKY4_9BRAD|nr:hypothetical protein [Bradyrhizobium valentinum]KRQ96360.1 hypothetical protein CQ10_30885 [Bradyrhizobium valentinum]KRR04747.1 hypothetical protein CP49_18795 [Bradyrhizobium valentinum]